VAKSSFVPVLVGHAIDDDFIRPHHSDRIFDGYMGDKNIIKFEGDHNSPRPQFYFDSINIFFHNVLQPPEDEVGGAFLDPMDDYFGKGSWRNVHAAYKHESSLASKEPATSSTAKQLRPKRPMSRTEVPSNFPSKDDQSEDEDEKNDGNLSPSSPKMISFDLSNGHPVGPHVPTTLDDDQYVEYELDDLTGFPCNAEEEERMFMEAVIESLRDLEMRNPLAGDSPGVSSSSVKPVHKDDQEASPIEHCRPLKTESTSTSVEHCEPSKTESTDNSVINAQNLASEHPSPDIRVPLGPAADATSSITETASTGTSARSDTSGSASIQSSSDADMSANTKATLTVERNPAGHLMDGLMRRWDLNFFRNSHNR
jgi:hypothetical protein